MKKEQTERIENPELKREQEEQDIQEGKRTTLVDKGIAPVNSSTWVKF